MSAIESTAPSPDPFSSMPEPCPGFRLDRFLSQVRAHLILRALEKSGGNQTAAAGLLCVSKQAISQFINDKRD